MKLKTCDSVHPSPTIQSPKSQTFSDRVPPTTSSSAALQRPQKTRTLPPTMVSTTTKNRSTPTMLEAMPTLTRMEPTSKLRSQKRTRRAPTRNNPIPLIPNKNTRAHFQVRSSLPHLPLSTIAFLVFLATTSSCVISNLFDKYSSNDNHNLRLGSWGNYSLVVDAASAKLPALRTRDNFQKSHRNHDFKHDEEKEGEQEGGELEEKLLMRQNDSSESDLFDTPFITLFQEQNFNNGKTKNNKQHDDYNDIIYSTSRLLQNTTEEIPADIPQNTTEETPADLVQNTTEETPADLVQNTTEETPTDQDTDPPQSTTEETPTDLVPYGPVVTKYIYLILYGIDVLPDPIEWATLTSEYLTNFFVSSGGSRIYEPSVEIEFAKELGTGGQLEILYIQTVSYKMDASRAEQMSPDEMVAGPFYIEANRQKYVGFLKEMGGSGYDMLNGCSIAEVLGDLNLDGGAGSGDDSGSGEGEGNYTVYYIAGGAGGLVLLLCLCCCCCVCAYFMYRFMNKNEEEDSDYEIDSDDEEY